MRKWPSLVASSSAILVGVIGMALVARLAPDVPPYLLAPAPADLGPVLVVQLAAFVTLLVGLPSFGLSAGSVLAPPRLLLPVGITGFCAGLVLSSLLLLRVAWGTASSALATIPRKPAAHPS